MMATTNPSEIGPDSKWQAQQNRIDHADKSGCHLIYALPF